MRSELHLSSRKTLLPNGGDASASTASNFFPVFKRKLEQKFQFGNIVACLPAFLACRSDSDRDVLALLIVDLELKFMQQKRRIESSPDAFM